MESDRRQLDAAAPLTWAERPFLELRRLAWPTTVSMLSYALMTLVDTLFVGWLGSAELAGVGLAGTALWALIFFSFGLLRGGKILVSQARGAGDHGSIGPYLGAALLSAAVLGVVTLAVAAGVSVMLPSLSSTAEAGVAAQSYFRVRMLTIPVLLLSTAVREVRYGLGDSKTPMRAALVANATNIGLDYLFIFGFDWGVTGAGAATAIAQCVDAALLFWAQARAGLDVRGTRAVHLRVFWRLGVPTGLQYLLEVGSFAVLASMLAKLSDMDMAAHMIALQVVHFSFLPAAAIGEGASVMVGEALGAGREALVGPVARLAMRMAGAYTAVCALVFWLGGPWLAGGFTDDPELLALTVRLLMVAAVFQVFDAANIVGRCVLRGVGDVRVPAVICIVIAWVVTPPTTWWLGYHLGYGALGAWIGLCGEIVAGAGLLWWRLERGTWREAARQTADERDRARAAVAVASA